MDRAERPRHQEGAGVWRVGAHRGRYVAILGTGPNRRRVVLDAITQREAEAEVASLNRAEEIRSRAGDLSVVALWRLYIKDRQLDGKDLTRIEKAWIKLSQSFGHLRPETLTRDRCRAYIAQRRRDSISDGTIRTELGYLSAALSYAYAEGLITHKPRLVLPPPARPRERYLTPEEAKRLIEAAEAEHVRLFILLSIATAARPSHLLQLTWDRVDLDAGIANLDDPTRERTRKGRARVPLNGEAVEALYHAKLRSRSGYVIEYLGRPVGTVRAGVEAAARRAGLKDVTQYTLRHTAGVWMAKAGIELQRIAAYMGHTSIETTRRHYAHHHPEHLRDASEALEVGA